MAEQIELPILAGTEPPRDGLRRRILAIDGMDDFFDVEDFKYPLDRRPRRFQPIALAAKFRGDAPADFEAGPPRRKPRSDPPDKFSDRFFLDHEHAPPVQHP